MSSKLLDAWSGDSQMKTAPALLQSRQFSLMQYSGLDISIVLTDKILYFIGLVIVAGTDIVN